MPVAVSLSWTVWPQDCPWPAQLSHLLPLSVPAVKLLSFGLAHHHRIGSLQVGRVCHQRQGDVPVGHTVDPPVIHAQVVLHISRALPAQTVRLLPRQGDAYPL